MFRKAVPVMVLVWLGLLLSGCAPYPNLRVWIIAEPPEGPAPLWVQFRAGVGFAGGEIIRFEWDFGDGNDAIGPSVLHIYETPGTYVATLTVTHDSGATASGTKTIRVDPPALQILEYRYWLEPTGRLQVEGRAQNISPRRLTRASVWVKVYDADGALIGKASAWTDNLESREVWRFVIRCPTEWPDEIAWVEVVVGECRYW
ncbi:MAG: PKD domain-containing protein [Anaerolineae bacterium]|uniref:PKD domain-containing protein n=1 Tax=Candidatus Hadarchaeum sp. TaxID=2883567 RepID=UPI003C830112